VGRKCTGSNEQPEILQGKSLAGYIMKNEAINAESLAYTISYGGKGASIRSNRWRYTRWGEDIAVKNEELYDHFNDPEEINNLAQESEQLEILIEMRSKFEKVRKKVRTKIEID
jgi:iduronate 2-sulfatase